MCKSVTGLNHFEYVHNDLKISQNTHSSEKNPQIRMCRADADMSKLELGAVNTIPYINVLTREIKYYHYLLKHILHLHFNSFKFRLQLHTVQKRSTNLKHGSFLRGDEEIWLHNCVLKSLLWFQNLITQGLMGCQCMISSLSCYKFASRNSSGFNRWQVPLLNCWYFPK